MNLMSRKKEFFLLIIVSVILIALFIKLFYNLNPTFHEAEMGYKDGTIVNLSKNIDEKTLSNVLEAGNYIENPEDLKNCVRNLVSKLDSLGSPENMGALNKHDFKIKTDSSNFSTERLKNENKILGIDTLYLLNNRINLPSRVGTGGLSIKGKVITKEKLSSIDHIKSKFYSLFNKPFGKPLSGTLIRLEQYFPELKSNQSEVDIPSIETYVKTDLNGFFEFNGLINGGSYSVIPLKDGFEFGKKQGTTNEEGKLMKDITCDFEGKTHTVKIFDTSTYQQIKEDKVFTVRTPKEFKSKFIFWVIIFFFSFWIVHIIWSIRKFNGDTLILPLIMLITGFGTLMMFAIQDPLRDTFRGDQTIFGIVLGLFALLIISQINVVKFLTVHGELFRYKNISFRKPNIFTNPWFWLGLSFLLMILLSLFGNGPEGSGVKVNLLGFQPSEVTKYLVIIFFAGYFSKNGIYLRQIPSINWRRNNTGGLFIGISLLLLIYLGLGDMGPAMVLCFAFLIMYASVRGELLEMVVGAVLYAILIKSIAILIPETQDKSAYLAVTFLYFLIWFAYGYFKKDFKESALFIVLMFAAFIFGENFHQRLKSRNDIFRDIWNNGVYHGDQISHGIWSLCSGGWFGQGLGKGYSKVMPANHTDMILPSIGEELGFVGLLILIICIGALLYRSILIAKRAGNDFAFYLGSGIAIVTGIQFFLIAFGAIGLVPLTGISVPFLSFGKAALLTNIAGLGIILSISCLYSTKTQSDYIRTNYDPIIKIGYRTFQIGFIILITTLSWYMILKPNDYIVKSCFIVNKNDQKIFSTNPRINILVRRLEAGNIFDRNNILLATSKKETLQFYSDTLRNSGAPQENIEKIQAKRLKRYYPFGEHLMFWLGDFNDGFSFNEGTSDLQGGYAAEYRHLTELRGFNNRNSLEKQTTQIDSNFYRPNRFTPPRNQMFTLTDYDYSDLVPLLKTGMDSTNMQFKEFKRRKQSNLKLTVDAILQTNIQKSIASSEFKGNRTSIVILNPTNGDVLTSAVYPIPNREQIKRMGEIRVDYNSQFFKLFKEELVSERDLGMTYATAPGSTAKILTSYAGLNKLGVNVVRKEAIVKNVIPAEIIHQGEPRGDVNMDDAIVKSSNVYFIWLANKYKLDKEMFELYFYTGMTLNGFGKNYFGAPDISSKSSLFKKWQSHFNEKVRCDDENHRGKLCPEKGNGGISGAAWGQGTLQATPLAIARMAGIVANNGNFVSSKFCQSQPESKHIKIENKEGISKELKSYMAKNGQIKKFNIQDKGAKTGTPEIIYPTKFVKTANGKYKVYGIKKNDAWFVFFGYSEKTNSPLVVAVRIEKTNEGVLSTRAADLSKKIVDVEMKKLGYF